MKPAGGLSRDLGGGAEVREALLTGHLTFCPRKTFTSCDSDTAIQGRHCRLSPGKDTIDGGLRCRRRGASGEQVREQVRQDVPCVEVRRIQCGVVDTHAPTGWQCSGKERAQELGDLAGAQASVTR